LPKATLKSHIIVYGELIGQPSRLQIVEPRLAYRALVVVDNIGQFPRDLRAVAKHLSIGRI